MKYQYKNFQQLMLLRLVRLQKYSHEESGFVLVIVISMVLILTSLLAAYGLLSKIEKASTTSSVISNTGFYSAEGELNVRANKVRDKFEGYNRPIGTTPGSWKNCLDTTQPQGSDDFKCEKKENFNKQTLLSYVQEDASNPIPIRIGTGEDFAGLSAQEYRYDVTSVAVNSQNLPTAILGMRFKSRLVPMFQFVVFYNNDADFYVPPTMKLNGPIHSNGNLYLDATASSGNTLTINGLISTTGKLYRGEKTSSDCLGTVAIFKVLDDPTSIKNLDCKNGSGSRAEYTQTQVSDWNNLIRVGIPRLEVPEPEALDPPNTALSTPGGDYWKKADLRVVLKLDNSGNPSGIEIRNQDNSVDTTKTTALLNSCPSNTTVKATLQNEANGTSNYENDDTILKVDSIIGFQKGDVVRVGTDYDSNVIAITPTANTITLKRRLVGNPSDPVTPVVLTGATVSKMSVSTSNTFYNYREKNGGTTGNDGTYIRMLNVDVRGLLDCVKANSLMGSKLLDDDTENGLVWFLTVEGLNSTTDVTSATAPNTSNNYAVRLYNGKYLYSGEAGAPEIQGLTIVSDQAVYLQGDYNTVKNNPLTPIEEGDNSLTPGVTERWRPASILADTINILSSNWSMDDSNGRTYASDVPSTKIDYNLRPNPLPTTVNAAFLSGTTITGGVNGAGGHGGVNSGGVNNYPRFHENWASTVPFNYKGSFVSLNAPRRTNSLFCGPASASTCNIYTPPIRNWDFDTDFNDAANLPPMAPQFVYLRQEVFSRNFEQ